MPIYPSNQSISAYKSSIYRSLWNVLFYIILIGATQTFISNPVIAREKPAEDVHVAPFNKQMYLGLPDYLKANANEKKKKQDEKAARKAAKRAEKQAKGKLVAPQSVEKNPAPLSESDVVRYVPYQVGKELNLWELESKKFFRSEPVLPPDQSGYAYTEVSYIPQTRQTFSRLYWVPLTPLPAPAPLLPSESDVPTQTRDASFYQDRLNPDKTTQIRQDILSVGNNRQVDYEFRTLTIVDWSANSQRLLFKQRSGVLHLGLKVSDVLVYNKGRGTVSIYPELERILRHYWLTHSAQLSDLDTVAWDIFPLGWAPGSDHQVIFKAWAYDKKFNAEKSGTSTRVFLGLWQYDIDLEQSQLLSLENAPYPLPANGVVPDFVTQPEPPKSIQPF